MRGRSSRKRASQSVRMSYRQHRRKPHRRRVLCRQSIFTQHRRHDLHLRRHGRSDADAVFAVTIARTCWQRCKSYESHCLRHTRRHLRARRVISTWNLLSSTLFELTQNSSCRERSSQTISWLALKKLNLTTKAKHSPGTQKCYNVIKWTQKTKARFGRLVWPPAWKRSRSNSTAPGAHTLVLFKRKWCYWLSCVLELQLAYYWSTAKCTLFS